MHTRWLYLLCLATAPAWAEPKIQRCTTPDGHVTFTQLGCAPDAAASSQRLASPAPPPASKANPQAKPRPSGKRSSNLTIVGPEGKASAPPARRQAKPKRLFNWDKRKFIGTQKSKKPA